MDISGPTPEDISQGLSEILEPGTMGLLTEDDKQGEPVDPTQSLGELKQNVVHIRTFSADLIKNIELAAISPQTENLRKARNSMAELLGVVSVAKAEIDKLCEFYKLPKLEA